jgi:hypothetical protein
MDILQLSPEALDAMFGEDTTQTKGEEKNIITDTIVIPEQGGLSSIQEFDLDTLEETKDKSEDNTDTDSDKPTVVDTIEDNTEDSNGANVKTVLKNTVNYLIEKGLWQDFEGREDLDVDEDTYAELATKQFEEKTQAMYQELIESTGEIGKAIIEHAKNGGNPDDIIDIFKEQKQLDSIDVSSEEGQVKVVSKYYYEVLGWKPERIQKHLKRIIEDNELEDESSDIVEKYKEHYTEELANIEREREERNAKRAERQQEFSNNVKQVLSKSEYTEKERKLIEQSLLNIKKTPNGPTTDFNLKFSELQKNPDKLVKLVHFVMDEEGFQKKLNKKAETTQAEKQFSFIKGNATTKKTVSGQTPTKKNSDLDFSFLLNK